jgi:hypothetical protein
MTKLTKIETVVAEIVINSFLIGLIVSLLFIVNKFSN